MTIEERATAYVTKLMPHLKSTQAIRQAYIDGARSVNDAYYRNDSQWYTYPDTNAGAVVAWCEIPKFEEE